MRVSSILNSLKFPKQSKVQVGSSMKLVRLGRLVGFCLVGFIPVVLVQPTIP